MSSFLITWYMFTIYLVFKLIFYWSIVALGFPGSSADNLPAMQETSVQFLGQEDPLEKG